MMKDVFAKVSTSISEAAKKTSQVVTEAIEHEDTQAALDWAKRTANTVADEAARLGKEVARSDMAKDAATGAAIGAAVAVPIPVIGPAAGAVIGAGLGIYKNITKPTVKTPALNAPRDELERPSTPPPDIYDVLIKLDELRKNGILTEEEFEEQKRKIINADKSQNKDAKT